VGVEDMEQLLIVHVGPLVKHPDVCFVERGARELAVTIERRNA